MTDSMAEDMLHSFFERWERLEGEKDAISADLRELFAEMKGNGFDTKVARKVFRDKLADSTERAEFEAVYDLYWSALSGPRARPARESGESTTHNSSVPAGFDPETGEEVTTSAGAQIAEGMTEAVAVARGEAEPYRIHQPQPETANEQPETHGSSPCIAAREADRPATYGQLVTGGESAASHSIPASTSPQTMLAGEGSGDGTTAAPLDNSNRQWTYADEPDPRCLNPIGCGGTSRFALCGRCKVKAGLVTVEAVE